MLKGKIHRATVKQAELDYVGSITVDPVLLEAAGILEYEHVHIVDVNNGSRFETYTIPGEPGSGMICLNGPAARCVATGDKIIIIAYADMTPEEIKVSIRAMLDRETDIATLQDVWMSLIEHLGEYKDLGHCECCGDWISNYTLEI